VVFIFLASVAAMLRYLVSWIVYMRFCRFLVTNTKSSASLKDAAVAAEAFRNTAP